MTTIQKKFGLLMIGLYAWLLTVIVGMVLIDILYARAIPAAAGAFSSISDLLLFAIIAVLFSAIGAITLAWNSIEARNLLIASLLVLMLEVLIPGLVSAFGWNGQTLAQIGPWLRITITGTASVLAFWGMVRYLRG